MTAKHDAVRKGNSAIRGMFERGCEDGGKVRKRKRI